MTNSYLNNALNSNRPSSLFPTPSPLEQARRAQELTRASRGGFNQSELYKVSPYPHKEPLPPLFGANTPDTMAPGRKTERQFTKIISDLENVVKKEQAKVVELEKENGELITERDEGFQDREERIAELLDQIRKQGGKRGGRKAEQKTDVNKSIDKFVKFVLFRTTKFAQPGENSLDESELNTATKKVWHGIKGEKRLEKGPLKLTESDFIEIYDSKVLTALSDCRQYVQTRTSAAIKDFMDSSKGVLPTVEEIEDVWVLPDAPVEPYADDDQFDTMDRAADYKKAKDEYAVAKAEYDKKHGLFCWCMCDWLPMAVGVDYWGPTMKSSKLMVDTELVPLDVSGKKKVLVTVTSEAFGQLMFKNCRNKWIASHKYKKENGAKAKLPKYSQKDETTHKYQNLWSNSRTGQVEGGGWSVEALEYQNERMEAISLVREEEKANDHFRMKIGRGYIQRNMGLVEASEQRKRSAAEANNAVVEGAVLRKKVKLTVIDE